MAQASYLYTSLDEGYSFDLSSLPLSNSLLKYTTTGAVSVPAIALPSTTSSDNDYLAGNLKLANLGGLSAAKGALVVATGSPSYYSQIFPDASGNVLVSTNSGLDPIPTWLSAGTINQVLTVTSVVDDVATVGWADAAGTGSVTSVAVTSSDLTVGGSPITTSGTITLALNTVSIAKGGTGQTSKTPAFDALAPTTTTGDLIYYNGTDNVRLAIGTANQVLKVSGGVPSWATLTNTGTVTSVAATSSDITITGSPITTSGTLGFTLNTVPIAKGGTNATTKTSAFDNLSPTTTAGDIIYYNGTDNVRLPIGEANEQLVVIDGLPAWGNGPADSTFLCATDEDLPTNGVDCSNVDVQISFGGLVADIPAEIGPSTFTVFDTSTGDTEGTPFQVICDTSAGSTNVSNWLIGYTGTVSDNMVNLSAQASRGSISSPVALLTNDVLFALDANGQFDTAVDDVSYVTSIRSIAEGNFSSGNTPGGLYFYTRDTADVAPVLRASINKSGLFTASNGISATALTLTSTPLALTSGGTGQTTKAAAFDALSPTTTTGDIIYYNGTDNVRLGIGSAGQFLSVSAGVPAWVTDTGTGTVTSVAASSSDITIGGSPITTAGTLTFSLNTVSIAKGGTGQTTQTAAFDALAPTTTAGDIIYYNGTDNIRLGAGAANSVLTSSGSAPQWTTSIGIASGGTGQATQTAAFDALAPTTTNGDMIYYNGTDNLRLAVGSANQVLTSFGGIPTWVGPITTLSGGTGLASYTAGDLSYFASGTSLSKLAIGPANSVLTSSGSAPQWTTTLLIASGGTGLTSFTAGDIPYYVSGTGLSKLAIGAANRILTSSGTAPQWVVAPYPTIATGAAGTVGQATISSGSSLVVNTTAALTTSRIFLTVAGYNAPADSSLGFPRITAISNGASFTIGLDVPVSGGSVLVNWFIINP